MTPDGHVPVEMAIAAVTMAMLPFNEDQKTHEQWVRLEVTRYNLLGLRQTYVNWDTAILCYPSRLIQEHGELIDEAELAYQQLITTLPDRSIDLLDRPRSFIEYLHEVRQVLDASFMFHVDSARAKMRALGVKVDA